MGDEEDSEREKERGSEREDLIQKQRNYQDIIEDSERKNCRNKRKK